MDVEFRATGLGKLKAMWGEFAGELIEPMAILAAGGTKAQAAWAGMRGIFLTKVLGPLGMVAGAATAFLFVTKKLVSEWRQVGVQGAKAVERLTLQFKPLLGSLELARKRAREVFNFTVKSPFRFEEVAEGNKMLEALTKGALAAKEGMELVGNAAAVSGQAFTDVARYVGRLYDGLMAGRPVGEATMRLQEMGLISGQLRNQIESMQAANASGIDIWRAVAKELERNKGGMDALSQSLEGLESTYEDTKQQLGAGFGKGFLEGEKAAVRATTAAMERLNPVGEYFGEIFGAVSNKVAGFKARLVDLATGFPGFATAVKVAGMGMLVLAGGIVAATGALVGKFIVGVLMAVTGNQRLAGSSAQVTAAQAAQTAATRTLAAAKARLTLASGAVARGEYIQAAAHARVAAAGTAAAVKTNAAAASQVILGGALKFSGAAIAFVTRQLALMAVALLANPVFWVATAVVAAGAAMMHFANKSRKAAEELEAFRKAGRATVENLEAQRRGIRTVNDLRAAEAAALNAVTQAHLAYRQAVEKGDQAAIEEAKGQVKAAKDKQAAIRGTDPASLDKSDVEREREEALRQARKRAMESAADFDAQRGPDSESRVARADFDKKQGQMSRAEAELKREKEARARQAEIQRRVQDSAPREAELLAMRAELDPATQGDQLAEVERQLKKIQQMKRQAAAEESAVAMESGSELMQIQEKIKLHDREAAAVAAVAAAKAKLREIERGDGESAEDYEKRLAQAGLELKQAADEARNAKAAAAAAGVGEGSGVNRQAMMDRAAVLEAERTEALDPARVEEARQRAVEAELRLIQAKLDGEQQIASLRLRGYDREKEILVLEQQKLDAAREKDRIDGEAYRREKDILDERAAALRREAAERGQELREALQIAGLKRQEEAARDGGDPVRAEALRRAREQREDERTRRDAEREARDLAPGDRADLVKKRLEEEQASRKQEREKEERGRGLGRDQSRADAGSAVAELQERVLRSQGRTEEAKRVREEAARKQDEVNRRESRQRLIDQGMGEKEAGQLADQQVKSGQAARLLERLSGQSATIVADSLAAVGGGGGVTGTDSQTRYLERMVRLLEEVKDNTKRDIDTNGW